MTTPLPPLSLSPCSGSAWGWGGGRSLLSASPQLGAGIIRNNLAIPIGYLAIGGNLDCTSFSLCFASTFSPCFASLLRINFFALFPLIFFFSFQIFPFSFGIKFMLVLIKCIINKEFLVVSKEIQLCNPSFSLFNPALQSQQLNPAVPS